MKQQPRFSIILPNIRSAHNVGAMFRTADACGVDHVYITGYTATPPHPQIDKVSLGAEIWMSWSYHKDVLSLLRRLKKQGVQLLALEKTSESQDIANMALKPPLSLVVGNEVEGLTPDILALCDVVAHIPMYGKKESLNVSIAAGIGMYQIKKFLMSNI